MIVLAAKKLFMRSKVKKALLATFNLMIEVSSSWSKLWNIIDTFDLMKNWISISWLFFQTHEKHEFWSQTQVLISWKTQVLFS